METVYPMASIGDVAKTVKRAEVTDPTVTYRQIGVRLWGKGAYEREAISGAETRYKELFRVEKDDIIVNKIWARNGSVAVVPPELAGCYGSSEFPTFEPDRHKLEPRWFHWVTKTSFFWQQCDEESHGTSGKNRIRPERFLEIEIPLPPLDEQRRIVARIEELAALIEEARGLRVKAREEAEALPFEAFQELVDKGMANSWAIRSLSEVCEINPSRKGQTNHSDDMQVSFVPMPAVDDVTGSIAWPEIRSFSEVKRGYKWFLEGDVIFARITPCMQNGKSAIAKRLVNGVGFGSTEFHVIRPGEEITAEWIHRIVRQPPFRRDAAASFKGSAGQQRVPRAFLEAYEVPVPTIDEQRRIVAYLDGLQAQVDELTALQDTTQAELEALLPSVLDRAFRGEL